MGVDVAAATAVHVLTPSGRRASGATRRRGRDLQGHGLMLASSSTSRFLMSPAQVEKVVGKKGFAASPASSWRIVGLQPDPQRQDNARGGRRPRQDVFPTHRTGVTDG